MRGYVVPLLIGVAGAAILIWLGLWQLHRLEWKEAILDEIDTRLLAAPVALPDSPDRARDRFLSVELSGRTRAPELHVLVSTRQHGAGFRIITAFETDTGRTLLLDRGFVPAAQKETPRPPAQLKVIGNLHWPDERDSFTPDNDPATNHWYARDVEVMADALGTEPTLVIARIASGDSAVSPLPVESAGIPNDHLGYAVTWFGLAAVWLGMTALLLWRISRRKTPSTQSEA